MVQSSVVQTEEPTRASGAPLLCFYVLGDTGSSRASASGGRGQTAQENR